MKQIDLSNVQESGERKQIMAGAYVAIINKVEDMSEKEYLKITFDIAAGEFKGYFENQRKFFEEQGWSTEWVGAFSRSYKMSALPFFKRFCSAVSKSNGSFVFDGAVNSDEQTLVGKQFGIILRDEEYLTSNGEKRMIVKPYSECPVNRIEYAKIPKPMLLSKSAPVSKPSFEFLSDDEKTPFDETIPF